MTGDDDGWPRRSGPEPGVSEKDALEDAGGTDGKALQRELDQVPVDRIVTNVDQTKIVTTRDRLQIILSEVTADLAGGRDWKAPLGTAVGLVVSLVGSSFSEVSWLGLSADNVQGVIVLATLTVFAWLVWALLEPQRRPDADEIVRRTLERLEPGAKSADSRPGSPSARERRR